MDFFETTAKYAYRQSLKILTWRDLAVVFAIFIVSLLVDGSGRQSAIFHFYFLIFTWFLQSRLFPVKQ